MKLAQNNVRSVAASFALAPVWPKGEICTSTARAFCRRKFGVSCRRAVSAAGPPSVMMMSALVSASARSCLPWSR